MQGRQLARLELVREGDNQWRRLRCRHRVSRRCLDFASVAGQLRLEPCKDCQVCDRPPAAFIHGF